MIFRRELAALVVKGEKTATRRGVVFDNPRAIWRIEKPWRHQVGSIFPVQPGRGVTGIAKAEVTGRWVEPLAAVTPADARCEGFPTRDAFVEAFKAINGSWDPDARVHVVEFKLTGDDCPHCHGAGGGCDWNGEEGSGPWTCGHCFGTGVAVTDAAHQLIAELEEAERGA